MAGFMRLLRLRRWAGGFNGSISMADSGGWGTRDPEAEAAAPGRSDDRGGAETGAEGESRSTPPGDDGDDKARGEWEPEDLVGVGWAEEVVERLSDVVGATGSAGGAVVVVVGKRRSDGGWPMPLSGALGLRA